MCKNAVFILHFCSLRGSVSMRKEKPRKPLEEYGGYRKTFLCPTTGTHLCHLTSALSMQQDSVRLRRCGSRRHLRGRIAFQANLSLQPTNPGLQPEVTHSIAFQAKIVLLPTGWKAIDNRR